MKNNKRLKQRITALTLASTLLLGGCGRKNNSSFEFIENENNELVAIDDSYISKDYIKDYYVVEMYNNVTKTNEIYIARRSGVLVYKYYDIFTNFTIYDEFESISLFEFVKFSRLSDYIVALGFEQLEYSYEDMEKIYEVIKENYSFEDDSSLKKKRVIDYRI